MLKFFLGLTSLIALVSCAQLNPVQAGTSPISHSLFDKLLKKHVDDVGLVDYKGFLADRDKLRQYLDLLSNNAPNNEQWTDHDQIAYWINAYNAYTIELILEYYPLESIKDIGSSIQVPFVNTPWDIKFFKIGGEKYDLNNIEHDILRKKWEEPRIHFAVNCASLSCPQLRAEAYTGAKLDEQLDDQARRFINDDFRNNISEDQASLSKIFKWFSGDFEKVMDVEKFINQYTDIKITDKTDVEYKEYDWSLNQTE
ncbi:MAG: DUF547 domain-containing protein [Cyclobacteriaceae bacterium]